MNEIRTSLLNQALHLRSYQRELVDPMIASTQKMLEKSERLDRNLKNGESSFAVAVEKTLGDIEQAELFLNGAGKHFVQQVANEMLEGFKGNLNGYLSMVVNATQDEVGKCGPISEVYNATMVGACNAIIDPYVSTFPGNFYSTSLTPSG